MPISRREFEKGEPADLMRLIMEFLRSNPLSAYSVEELREVLASKQMNLSTEEVENILSLLEALDRIKSKVVGGAKYYKYKIIGFRPGR